MGYTLRFNLRDPQRSVDLDFNELWKLEPYRSPSTNSATFPSINDFASFEGLLMRRDISPTDLVRILYHPLDKRFVDAEIIYTTITIIDEFYTGTLVQVRD